MKLETVKYYCPRCYSLDCGVIEDYFECHECNYFLSDQGLFFQTNNKKNQKIFILSQALLSDSKDDILNFLNILKEYKLPETSGFFLEKIESKLRVCGFDDVAINYYCRGF